MRTLAPLILSFFLIVSFCGTEAAPQEGSFPPLYNETNLFLGAVEKGKTSPLPNRITGLTVPHHLLAADLIAEAFWSASAGSYRTVIILSPDHFSRSASPFAVTRKDFRTVLGKLTSDRELVARLLENRFVSESELFSHEHGVQAVLPFIARHFPGAKVVPIAIRTDATAAQVDSLAETIASVVTPHTLIVQSTDFSHFLPEREAFLKDQETLRAISAGDPESARMLTQPAHLDSQAAQYVQMRVQREVFRASPAVLANRNSQQYSRTPVKRTTSYIVQLYSPDPLSSCGGDRFFFAGDTFFGRHVATLLSREAGRTRLVEQVLAVTRGERIVVNLEGVLMGKCPRRMGPYELCMESALSIPLLKSLNVRAISLANNHVRDFGDQAYAEMKRLLSESGIAIIENRTVADLGRFRIAALTDVDNRTRSVSGLLSKKDLDFLETVDRDKPLFAMMHWGREYSSEAGPRERSLAALLKSRGVEFIIGSHSHRAGSLECDLNVCRIFSLGNLIFDQPGPNVSGKVLEVVFFPEGTYFARTHDIGNLYRSTAGHEDR